MELRLFQLPMTLRLLLRLLNQMLQQGFLPHLAEMPPQPLAGQHLLMVALQLLLTLPHQMLAKHVQARQQRHVLLQALQMERHTHLQSLQLTQLVPVIPALHHLQQHLLHLL